ncbi:hypothetical protein G7077_11760 [Sphingomonas piscis]|uniref:Uncharacterized protein n=1 Tax=Sphingomonas piscis TaxID=2714943 RepID=A0A6G7YRV5_9SPHN|nr:hypothetical protein [Sphingomonas piscis]QIK79478.1 hypothetical protein G7077_11760 [Sphingomonas piscis]
MTYGLQSLSRAQSSAPIFTAPSLPMVNSWRRLDADHRLQLIEQRLAESGVRDGYPLAL